MKQKQSMKKRLTQCLPQKNSLLTVLIIFVFFINITYSIDKKHSGLESTCIFASNPCNNRGTCTDQGFCLCDTYFYGQNCENEMNKDYKPDIKDGQIRSGELAGIVIGFIFAVLILYLLGMYLIYRNQRKNQQRYDASYHNPQQQDKNNFKLKKQIIDDQIVINDEYDIKQHPLFESTKSLEDKLNDIQLKKPKTKDYQKKSLLMLQIHDNTEDYGKKFVDLLKKQQDNNIVEVENVEVEVQEEKKQQIESKSQIEAPKIIKEKTSNEYDHGPQPADERYSLSRPGQQFPRISIQVPKISNQGRIEKIKQKGINRTNLISSDVSLVSSSRELNKKQRTEISNLDSGQKKEKYLYSLDQSESEDDEEILNLGKQQQKIQQQEKNLPKNEY